jgi:hypothetical protein
VLRSTGRIPQSSMSGNRMRGKMAAPAPQEVVIQYVFSKEVSEMLNWEAMESWATERMVPFVEQMKLCEEAEADCPPFLSWRPVVGILRVV